MRSVKVKEVAPYKVTVRLSDKEFNFIESSSQSINVTKSEYIRMLIDKNISKINYK